MADVARPTVPDVTDTLLAEIVSKIVKHFHPEKIILFGSRVWGAPTRESDLHIPADDNVNLNEVWDVVQGDTSVLISGLERIVPPEDEV